MEDQRIVELYLVRKEEAIEHSRIKYGAMLRGLAWRLLGDVEESEECENDGYYKAWNSIPPQRPSNLGGYLARLVRHSAIDRLRSRKQRPLSLEELGDICGRDDTVEAVDLRALTAALERFLQVQSQMHRAAFLLRYFYNMDIATIAKRLGVSQAKIKTDLFRLRAALREFLIGEGFDL